MNQKEIDEIRGNSKLRKFVFFLLIIFGLGSTMFLFSRKLIDANFDNSMPKEISGIEIIKDMRIKTPDKMMIIYERIANDLKDEKALIVTSYIAACPAHVYGNGTIPDNLYWDQMYGHKTLFDKSHKRDRVKHITPNTKWERISLQKQEDEELRRIAIYKSTVKPNDFWRSKGVEQDFVILNIMLLYKNQIQTITDLTKNTKQDIGISVNYNNSEINIGEASHITTFYGHNSFYDYSSIGLLSIINTKISSEGIFIAGCKTLTVGNIPDKVEGTNDIGIGYSTDFMGPEGYISLSLIESISQGKSVKEILKNVNYANQYFHGQNWTSHLFKTRLSKNGR